MNNTSLTDLFAYVDGTLTKEASAEITKRIASDPILQQQYLDLLAFEKNLNSEFVGVNIPRSLQASVMRQLRPKRVITQTNNLAVSTYVIINIFLLTLIGFEVWQGTPATSNQFLSAIPEVIQKLKVVKIPIFLINSLFIVGMLLPFLIIIDKAYMQLAKKMKG